MGNLKSLNTITLAIAFLAAVVLLINSGVNKSWSDRETIVFTQSESTYNEIRKFDSIYDEDKSTLQVKYSGLLEDLIQQIDENESTTLDSITIREVRGQDSTEVLLSISALSLLGIVLFGLIASVLNRQKRNIGKYFAAFITTGVFTAFSLAGLVSLFSTFVETSLFDIYVILIGSFIFSFVSLALITFHDSENDFPGYNQISYASLALVPFFLLLSIPLGSEFIVTGFLYSMSTVLILVNLKSLVKLLDLSDKKLLTNLLNFRKSSEGHKSKLVEKVKQRTIANKTTRGHSKVKRKKK